MSALASVTSRRIWFVPDVIVWGLPGLGDVKFLAVEDVDGVSSVHFCATNIGTGEQLIMFTQLIDHRGNNLPVSIKSPRIIVRSHSEDAAFIVARESQSSFKIARDPGAAGSVTVDLFIVEMND